MQRHRERHRRVWARCLGGPVPLRHRSVKPQGLLPAASHPEISLFCSAVGRAPLLWETEGYSLSCTSTVLARSTECEARVSSVEQTRRSRRRCPPWSALQQGRYSEPLACLLAYHKTLPICCTTNDATTSQNALAQGECYAGFDLDARPFVPATYCNQIDDGRVRCVRDSTLGPSWAGANCRSAPAGALCCRNGATVLLIGARCWRRRFRTGSMTDKPTRDGGPRRPKESARQLRLAEALRDNLSKRRAQQRARQIVEDEPGKSDADAGHDPGPSDPRG